MKKYFLILILSTAFFLKSFSQESMAIENRFYISVAEKKNEIIAKIKENIPDLQSVYHLKNSDIIVFETKNIQQQYRLRDVIKEFGIDLKQDYKLPYNTCTTPSFVASDPYNDMGYWNSLNQNILKEKQLMDSIFWLIKPQYWNNENESNETVKLILSEIPNLSHQDMPAIDSVNSFDYYRNTTVSGTNATLHGSETGGVAFAKINNGLDMAGMSNVGKPIIKNNGTETFAIAPSTIAVIQSAINETYQNPNTRQIISNSSGIATVDPTLDLLFNSADTNQRVLLINSAGNNNLPIGQTMSNFHPSVLTVQAGNGFGAKASFSSYNAAISFKGVSMWGLTNTANTGTVNWQGTSASAPGAAGAAHLLWSLMPSKTAGEIRAMLVDSLNTTTLITNPSNTRTPSLRIGYLIQNLHFDIVHDYKDSVGTASNGGIANLNNSVHDIQGGTIGNPTFWYQKNQTGNWIQIPNGLLNKADLGAGDHFLKLEFDILHQPGKCTQIVRPLKLFTSMAYTFTGNGNWSTPSNWKNNLVPQLTLTNGTEVIINPTGTGECVVNVVNQTISTGAKVTVNKGKKIRVVNKFNLLTGGKFEVL